MGSLVLDVLRKGIWSSFTGGWYYEPNSSSFTNTLHLYFFLFLLCFPFGIYVYLPESGLNWFVYTTVIGFVFAVIKFINYGLHRMYDTTEYKVEEPCSKNTSTDEKTQPTPKAETQNAEEEGIELQVLNSDRNANESKPEESNTYESNEFLDYPSTASKEDVGEGAGSCTIDLKVDVHRNDSSSSSTEEVESSKVENRSIADTVDETENVKDGASNEQESSHPGGSTSAEDFITKHRDLNKLRKRIIRPEITSEEAKTAENDSDNNGRLSERSRQYSVSVTLGEGNKNTPSTSDPTVTKSMQLNSEYEDESQTSPGLLYWKDKWSATNSERQVGAKTGRGTRRSSSPRYTSDIVYPIAEQTDEQTAKKSPVNSDDEENGRRVTADDDSSNGDEADSHSPLLPVHAPSRPTGVQMPVTRKNAFYGKRGLEALLAAEKEQRAATSSADEETQVANMFKWLYSDEPQIDDVSQKEVRDPSEFYAEGTTHATSKDYERPFIKFRREKSKRFFSSPTLAASNVPELNSVNLQQSVSHSLDEMKVESDDGKSEEATESSSAYGEMMDTEQSTSCERMLDGTLHDESVVEIEPGFLVEELAPTHLAPIPPMFRSTRNSMCAYLPMAAGRRCSSSRNDGRTSRNRHRHPVRRTRSSIREAFPMATMTTTSSNNYVQEPADLSSFLRELYRDESESALRRCAMNYVMEEERANRRDDGRVVIYRCPQGSGVGVDATNPAVAARLPRRKDALNPLDEVLIRDHVHACSSSSTDDCTMFVNSASDYQPQVEDTGIAAPLFQLRENENGSCVVERIPPARLMCSHQIPGGPTHGLRFTPAGRTTPSLPDSDSAVERARLHYMHFMEQLVPSGPTETPSAGPVRRPLKRYYEFQCTPCIKFKVNFDRLFLNALLDYNRTCVETIVCITLALMVSALGAMMLHMNYYYDLSAFAFCFVIASAQYSLLKSVQPDASSPVHGFNKIVAYSRPVYFVACASTILTMKVALDHGLKYQLMMYNITLDFGAIVRWMHEFLRTLILFFPILFTLGLFPQINTFSMYILEQLDMHLFGGTALTSLKAGIYSMFRSFLAVGSLFGFAYGALTEPDLSHHILFSMYVSFLTIVSYNLSRCACDPTNVCYLMKKHLWPIDELPSVQERMKKAKEMEKEQKEGEGSIEVNLNTDQGDGEAGVQISDKRKELEDDENSDDPMPKRVQKIFNARLQSDLILSLVTGILIFCIHRSSIFQALQPSVMWGIACVVGFLIHYIMPQLRKQLPWLCVARPVLRSCEYEQFEALGPAVVTWFEKVYMYVGFVEKNIIYPVMFICCITLDAPELMKRIGPLGGSVVLTICSLKCLRLSFSHISSQYLILAFTVCFFQIEHVSEAFVVDYFLISIVFYKIQDLMLKVKFVLTYIAPWQITWGSAFHAFAQPFSLPHSAMMFAQAALSAFLSSPLYPFLGSAIFLTSYPRPVKFWERDYNTRRVDHSNTKMASHLDRNLGADDNNLNSIFYEHLTRSLQDSLCGDLYMGRWGEVSSGDCFILASDYLNCLIHIIELGNGLVTFQMRGLEFRGTYCQQREVEAITDGVEENNGCCCCKPGHLPHMLSLNAAFSQRWLAWEVTTGKYILEGYSISDNSAGSMLQVFDFRKMLISYYVKSIIYFAVTSPKLNRWLNSKNILDALQAIKEKNFVDLDPVFNMNVDEDFDFRFSGITRNTFCNTYLQWIRYCNSKRVDPVPDVTKDSVLVSLCFALSLLGRRTLGTASHNTAASVEYFLYGIHTLFKGDFRIASVRDEWVFNDMELLRKVVAPAIRMSLKLHQDHFMAPDEYECSPALFTAISTHQENLVISHEGDPVWRKAVLSGMPSLLALRRVMDEGSDDYKIIMLNKRYLSFRLIKMNRECVRGLWAGQQQELVFLRNANPERGSIQNARQALRNIINSSCDQPIGYPIFVSPLTTSYIETNKQYTRYLGGPISLLSIKDFVLNFCRRIRNRCIEGCSSGSSAHSQDDNGFSHEGVYTMTTFNVHSNPRSGSHQSMETSLTGSGGTITRVSGRTGGPSKPGLVTLAGLLSPPGNPIPEAFRMSDRKMAEREEDDKEPIMHRVKITNPALVHDGINQGRLIDVIWPDEVMRQRGGRNFWKDWLPEVGMEGQVVHRWIPNHPNPNKRSIFDRTILLVKIDDNYVPISENGVQDLGAEV